MVSQARATWFGFSHVKVDCDCSSKELGDEQAYRKIVEAIGLCEANSAPGSSFALN
jgi:hypothetical protein